MVCFQFNLKPHFKIIIAAGIASSVSACGGGGGGGGGGGSVGGSISRLPITITNPDPSVVIEPSALELSNTPSLGDVAATSVYHLGVSGEGITIGLVDSGVDKNHDELAGRVIGGGDWQSSGDGTSDPYGHGTHVASIIAASSNNKGMQGIAPLAEIVSYRILNSAGKFGGKSGNDMLPAVLGDVRARKHGLSEVTVKHHLKSLRGKLGAKNRTHAVCRAIELGIVPE